MKIFIELILIPFLLGAVIGCIVVSITGRSRIDS